MAFSEPNQRRCGAWALGSCIILALCAAPLPRALAQKMTPEEKEKRSEYAGKVEQIEHQLKKTEAKMQMLFERIAADPKNAGDLKGRKTARDVCETLVRAANEVGGTDNITTVVVRFRRTRRDTTRATDEAVAIPRITGPVDTAHTVRQQPVK